MKIKRYDYTETNEYVYVLTLPSVEVRTDKLFLDAIDEELHSQVEAALAKKLFYQMFRQFQEMHKNGKLPEVDHR